MGWESINKPSKVLNQTEAMVEAQIRVNSGFEEVTITRINHEHGGLHGWVVNNKHEKINLVD